MIFFMVFLIAGSVMQTDEFKERQTGHFLFVFIIVNKQLRQFHQLMGFSTVENHDAEDQYGKYSFQLYKGTLNKKEKQTGWFAFRCVNMFGIRRQRRGVQILQCMGV